MTLRTLINQKSIGISDIYVISNLIICSNTIMTSLTSKTTKASNISKTQKELRLQYFKISRRK